MPQAVGDKGQTSHTSSPATIHNSKKRARCSSPALAPRKASRIVGKQSVGEKERAASAPHPKTARKKPASSAVRTPAPTQMADASSAASPPRTPSRPPPTRQQTPPTPHCPPTPPQQTAWAPSTPPNGNSFPNPYGSHPPTPGAYTSPTTTQPASPSKARPALAPKPNPATQNQLPVPPQRKIITRKPAGVEQMLITRKPAPAVKPLPGAMGRRREVFTEMHKKTRVDDKVDRVGEGLQKIQDWQQERRLAAEREGVRKAAEKTVEVKRPLAKSAGVKGAGVKKEVNKDDGRKVEGRKVELGLTRVVRRETGREDQGGGGFKVGNGVVLSGEWLFGEF